MQTSSDSHSAASVVLDLDDHIGCLGVGVLRPQLDQRSGGHEGLSTDESGIVRAGSERLELQCFREGLIRSSKDEPDARILLRRAAEFNP